MKRALMCLCLATVCNLSQATVINTKDPAAVAAFQSGINVVDFESISGKTPQSITSYTHNAPGSPGDPVGSATEDPFVFDQLPGVQFSVGGMVGTNEPALFKLSGDIAKDAHSGSTVLGSVQFDFTTRFDNTGLIEIFFPKKVSKVGFWLNPSLSLGDVHMIALNTNFAFSKDPNEINLELGDGTKGNFVGIERPTADIGGFKIQAASDGGFTLDDFSYGGAVVPEPSTWTFLLVALSAMGIWVRRST